MFSGFVELSKLTVFKLYQSCFFFLFFCLGFSSAAFFLLPDIFRNVVIIDVRKSSEETGLAIPSRKKNRGRNMIFKASE